MNIMVLLVISTTFFQILTVAPLLEIITKKFKRNSLEIDKDDSPGMVIAFNLLILSTIYYLSCRFGATGHQAGLIVSFYLLTNLLIESRATNGFKFIFNNLFKHGIHVMIAIFQILPAIVKLSQANVILGAATTGNNDISSYALVSKAFLLEGFDSANLIAGVDLNSFAETSAYQTPNFLISFLATFFDNSPLRVMILVQVIALTFVSLCFYELVRHLAPKANSNFLRIMSSFIMFFPLNNYIVANYFLAHILSLGVLTLLLFKLLKLKQSYCFRNVLEVSLIFALNIYVYPPVALPLFVIFCLVIFVASYESLEDILKFSQKLIEALILGLIITAPYLMTSINLLRAQSEVLAGWPIPAMSPMALLVWPQLIGWVLPFASIVVLWLFTFLAFFLGTRKFSDADVQRFLYVIVTTFVLVFILYLKLSNRDISDYQSWKLQSFFVCIIIIIALSSTVSIKTLGTPILFIVIGLLSSTPMIEWWPALNARNNVSSQASLTINNDLQINSLKVVNVDVSPYFKTMNLASELLNSNKTVYLNSQSYYTSSSNLSACTIVDNSDLRSSFGRQINIEFTLIPSEDKSCDPFVDFLK